MKILIIDDEKEALSALQKLLKRKNFESVDVAENGSKGMQLLNNNNYDLVFLDLIMPDIHGLELLEKVKPALPETEFVILTAVDDVSQAMKAVKLGAYDYLVKPVDPEKIILSAKHAFEKKGFNSLLNNRVEISDAFKTIITNDTKMLELFSYLQVMSQSGNPILITGESGTGKELLAKAIHKFCMPGNTPFIPVNVSSIPDTLFESHFFGHKKGAFTGAENDYKGLFLQANGGTLFLDEIGELPANQQPKFLRVLEENFVTPLGQAGAIPINVRIISATNKNIDKACAEGKFRLDLLYRIKSVHVKLPPLTERGNDIILLAEHFIKKYAAKYGKEKLQLSADAAKYLSSRDYPGNVRELSQLIENAVLLTKTHVLNTSVFGIDNLSEVQPRAERLSLKENTNEYFLSVLESVNGDKNAAAEILGISLRQVQRKLHELKTSILWKSRAEKLEG